MKVQDMPTILLSDSLSKEINKVAREFGYMEEKQFIEDMLKEKILEYKRQMFMKGVANIRRKLAVKGLTEDEIIADFERFRHSQSRSPAA
jgi:metal-responsive CopG/Arc/MetJ family transcriptional regulator